MDVLNELYQQISFRANLKGQSLYEKTERLWEKRSEYKDKLTALLDEKGKEYLFTYEEALNELNSLESYEMFRMGAKTGASLMRELSCCMEDASGEIKL